jgi:hypothetical protein
MQIYEHVWGYNMDPETNLVEVYIQRLRCEDRQGSTTRSSSAPCAAWVMRWVGREDLTQRIGSKSRNLLEPSRITSGLRERMRAADLRGGPVTAMNPAAVFACHRSGIGSHDA